MPTTQATHFLPLFGRPAFSSTGLTKCRYAPRWAAAGDPLVLYVSSTPIVIPETQLTNASCGSALSSVNDYFYIDPVGGATRYQYEISDANGVLATVQSLNAYPTADWFSLYYVSGIECNTTYTIRVRAQMFGSWGSWGPS